MTVSLAERLKSARETTGKSQKEMAALLGVSFRAWQDYEAGNNVPGGKVFEALVRHGFDGTWLLTGQGAMRPAFTDLLAEPAYRSPPTDAGQTPGFKTDTATAKAGTAAPEPAEKNRRSDRGHFWFHDWIDEELQGRSISEVMAVAVRIKAILDETRKE